MAFVDVGDVRLQVRETGSGQPLVLVHGSWGDRHTWELVEDDLARSFHVVS